MIVCFVTALGAASLLASPRQVGAQAPGPQLLGVAVAEALPVGEERLVAASFGHVSGLDALYQAYLVIARADGAPGCTVFFERTTGALALRSDSGQFVNLGVPGGAGSASSSWCALRAQASRVTERDGVLTIEFALTLQARLEGTVEVFETAVDRDGRSAAPRKQATVRVGRGPLAPSTVSADLDAVTAGRAASITATYSDQNSWQTLTELYLVAADGVGGAGCYARYLPATNMLQLRGSGDAWLDAGAPGADGAATSGNCALNARASSASGAGEYVTVRYALTFAAPFVGKHRLFLLAVDDANLRTYWDDRGSLLIGARPLSLGEHLGTFVREQAFTWSGLFVVMTLAAAAVRMSPRIAWGAAAVALLLAAVLATLHIAAAEPVTALALALLVLGAVLEVRDRRLPAWSSPWRHRA
ncbi:MAG: hypothetical protein DWI48_01025 [Chloroflexi bacterium]|nr:MAG: hypothetical protein DWI48_01025 [Chloroflexota bacterium]